MNHWSNSSLHNTQDFGFTYVITNKLNYKKYIGCKQFKFARNRSSKWETYTGSSTTLNKDIKTLGKDNFTFEILATYKTKQLLKYAEAKLIINNNCIFDSNYYNEFLSIKIRNKK